MEKWSVNTTGARVNSQSCQYPDCLGVGPAFETNAAEAVLDLHSRKVVEKASLSRLLKAALQDTEIWTVWQRNNQLPGLCLQAYTRNLLKASPTCGIPLWKCRLGSCILKTANKNPQECLCWTRAVEKPGWQSLEYIPVRQRGAGVVPYCFGKNGAPLCQNCSFTGGEWCVSV